MQTDVEDSDINAAEPPVEDRDVSDVEPATEAEDYFTDEFVRDW